MKVGVVLPHGGRVVEQPHALRDVSVASEELGYDSLWVGDHMAMPAKAETAYPWSVEGQAPIPADRKLLEPFTTLSYVAALTSTIELGIGVCIAPYRRSVEIAKIVGSIDFLTGGRFIFGAGTGWMREEFDALGVAFGSRGQVTDETLQFLSAWQAPDGPVSFKGDGWLVREMHIEPRSFQNRHVPVWIGGRGDAAARRAARFGDAWYPPLFGAEPKQLAERFALAHEVARELGRPEPALTMYVPYVWADRPADSPAWESGAVVGPPGVLAETLNTYANVGLSHVVLSIGGGISARLKALDDLAATLFG